MKILHRHAGKKSWREEDYLEYTHKMCGRCESIKPVGDFGKQKSRTRRGWSYRSYCKECNRELCRDYGVSNRDKRNERLRKWRRNNPEKAKERDKRDRLKVKYGLTTESLERLKKENNYCCWICGIKEEDKRLIIEHNHVTGDVRGIVCDRCNQIVGAYEAMDVARIEEYLNSGKARKILLELANG